MSEQDQIVEQNGLGFSRETTKSSNDPFQSESAATDVSDESQSSDVGPIGEAAASHDRHDAVEPELGADEDPLDDQDIDPFGEISDDEDAEAPHTAEGADPFATAVTSENPRTVSQLVSATVLGSGLPTWPVPREPDAASEPEAAEAEDEKTGASGFQWESSRTASQLVYDTAANGVSNTLEAAGDLEVDESNADDVEEVIEQVSDEVEAPDVGSTLEGARTVSELVSETVGEEGPLLDGAARSVTNAGFTVEPAETSDIENKTEVADYAANELADELSRLDADNSEEREPFGERTVSELVADTVVDRIQDSGTPPEEETEEIAPELATSPEPDQNFEAQADELAPEFVGDDNELDEERAPFGLSDPEEAADEISALETGEPAVTDDTLETAPQTGMASDWEGTEENGDEDAQDFDVQMSDAAADDTSAVVPVTKPQRVARSERPQHPRVALMGEFSAGKSTLSNLLIGASALPVSVTATQLPPVWIAKGDEQPFRVDLDGSEHDVSLDQLEQVSVARTNHIRIFQKAEILDRCDIIDMPGISDPNMAAEVWQRVIHNADIVIWCSHATQAWRQSEAAVWSTMPKELYRRSLLLLTRMDKILSERDRMRVVKRVESETKGLFRSVLPVSLIKALNTGRDSEDWAESGVDLLLEKLFGLIDEVASGGPLPRSRNVDEISPPFKPHVEDVPKTSKIVMPTRIRPRSLGSTS